jgi:prolycopene isomerase
MEYDSVIIGSGIGGLVAALKLSCLGKKVLLLEKQPQPGGLVTTFKRGGFSFESVIHCVDALGRGGEIRDFLRKFRIDKKVDFIELQDFCRIIYPEHDFVIDFNHLNFINYLKKNFPRQEKEIERLFFEIDKFYKQFDGFYTLKLPLYLRLISLPFIYPTIIKVSTLSVEQFIGRYIKDSKLKAIITDLWRFLGVPPSRLSAFYFLLVFRGYYYYPTAYIKGGFLQLFKAMAERIKENGSEVKFNTTVKQIITQRQRTKAVITDKQEEFKTKTVISNVNAIDTLCKLIDNDYIKKRYYKKLSKLEKSISAFQVYLGLRVPAKDLGMNHFMFSINTTYDHDDSFNYALEGNYQQCFLGLVDHAQIDPTFVPAGKGSLIIMTFDAYKNWCDLNEEEYKKKKIEVADKLIQRVEKYLPGLAKNIEIIQIATPLTISRFGSTLEGAIYGFAHTVGQSALFRLSAETKIRGLYLAGAWTRPGCGVHGCFISGITAADLVLRFLKK